MEEGWRWRVRREEGWEKRGGRRLREKEEVEGLKRKGRWKVGREREGGRLGERGEVEGWEKRGGRRLRETGEVEGLERKGR